jgi:small subunit ribosomal protein S17
MAEEKQEESSTGAAETGATEALTGAVGAGETGGSKRAHRSQKVGAVVSDKMQKTVVVRVDRLVRHMKYRRYVRRTSKFMAHDELGATVGDKVRIVETRPMSAKKRWRVIEIVQKAAK